MLIFLSVIFHYYLIFVCIIFFLILQYLLFAIYLFIARCLLVANLFITLLFTIHYCQLSINFLLFITTMLLPSVHYCVIEFLFYSLFRLVSSYNSPFVISILKIFISTFSFNLSKDWISVCLPNATCFSR